ncbi:MAG: hypothetical protein E6G18_06645 [Actinobacteria bacterium]|nr:MAG: hypothetical protein E6G18_06645 [Actinomycetota bacterium]
MPPYYRQLLDTAKRYMEQGEHSVAVIVAQTACELVTEFAFETLIRPHGLTRKEREQLLPRNYDLNNKRVNALYVVLSKDKIKARSFWEGYTTHANLRHAIVHKGEQATAQQAKASLSAASTLITHVEALTVAAANAS